ncbi:hypothetical protein T06_10576 [Trichinella sp. T6]|nr:hypothetical protein T06_10576 [Trichinella sp. T6]
MQNYLRASEQQPIKFTDRFLDMRKVIHTYHYNA